MYLLPSRYPLSSFNTVLITLLSTTMDNLIPTLNATLLPLPPLPYSSATSSIQTAISSIPPSRPATSPSFPMQPRPSRTTSLAPRYTFPPVWLEPAAAAGLAAAREHKKICRSKYAQYLLVPICLPHVSRKSRITIPRMIDNNKCKKDSAREISRTRSSLDFNNQPTERLFAPCRFPGSSSKDRHRM